LEYFHKFGFGKPKKSERAFGLEPTAKKIGVVHIGLPVSATLKGVVKESTVGDSLKA
jgi:hypothetical protein